MSVLQIHAGDFYEGKAEFSAGEFFLKSRQSDGAVENICASKIEVLDVASEENVKKVGGTVGWGAAGAVLLGPAGLVAGLLLGGKKKEVTFVTKFKDGRKLIATADSKLYKELQVEQFKAESNKNKTSVDEKPPVNSFWEQAKLDAKAQVEEAQKYQKAKPPGEKSFLRKLGNVVAVLVIAFMSLVIYTVFTSI